MVVPYEASADMAVWVAHHHGVMVTVLTFHLASSDSPSPSWKGPEGGPMLLPNGDDSPGPYRRVRGGSVTVQGA